MSINWSIRPESARPRGVQAGDLTVEIGLDPGRTLTYTFGVIE